MEPFIPTSLSTWTSSPALSPHRPPHLPMAGHTAWISLTLLMIALHQPADIWAHPLEIEPTDLFLDEDVANDFIGQSSEVSDLLESFTEQVEGAWERVKEIFEEITDVELME